MDKRTRHFRPTLSLPAFIPRDSQVAYLTCNTGQFKTYARICAATGRTQSVAIHIVAAIQLCHDIIGMYDRGSQVVISSPEIYEVNLHRLRAREMGTIHSRRPVTIDRDNAAMLKQIGLLVQARTLKDTLCSVWDNYLNIARRLYPPGGNTKPVLMELYGPPPETDQPLRQARHIVLPSL